MLANILDRICSSETIGFFVYAWCVLVLGSLLLGQFEVFVVVLSSLSCTQVVYLEEERNKRKPDECLINVVRDGFPLASSPLTCCATSLSAGASALFLLLL